MVLGLLSPLGTLWSRGGLGGLRFKTVAGRWRPRSSPGSVFPEWEDAGTLRFPEWGRRFRNEYNALEWETATFSIRLRLVFGKRLWWQWQPLAPFRAGAEPTSGPGTQLEGSWAPAGRSYRYSQALRGQLSRAASREVSFRRGVARLQDPSAPTPFLSLWLQPWAACHFLLTRKSFQSVFRDLLVLVFKWFLGFYSFDICLRKQLTSWPNLITCKGFTPNSASTPYRYLNWMCFMAGYI